MKVEIIHASSSGDVRVGEYEMPEVPAQNDVIEVGGERFIVQNRRWTTGSNASTTRVCLFVYRT